jgi:hypothetical protein
VRGRRHPAIGSVARWALSSSTPWPSTTPITLVSGCSPSLKALEEGKDDRANTRSLLALAHATDELTGLVPQLVEGLHSIERQLAQVAEALGQRGGTS